MSLSGKWFEGFSGNAEQRKSLELSIRNSRYILDILTNVIEKEVTALESTKRDDYETPNWALLAADKNGEIRALKRILQLTKIEGPR